MKRNFRGLSVLLVGCLLSAAAPSAPLQAHPVAPSSPSTTGTARQEPTEASTVPADRGRPGPNYVLSFDDEITIQVMDVSEIPPNPLRIDKSGHIRIPLVGQVKADGLTIEQFQALLTERLKTFVLSPEVTVSVSAYRSQPVSVMGAVKNPGVYQLEGLRTLVEVLSLAGGLDSSAGGTVKITRQLAQGRIPLGNASDDPTGQFSIAEANLNSNFGRREGINNIVLRPFDVIEVPRARMVYVIGQVTRAGGYILQERNTIGILQALALAGGLDSSASPQHVRVLRYSPGSSSRTEVPIDLKKILEGRTPDVELLPEDILFIPANVPKKAALRAVEAAVQMGTGVAIWR
jgi:polysaccharide biosynthesis/export protein